MPIHEKNHVVPTAWQDEALARDGVSRVNYAAVWNVIIINMRWWGGESKKEGEGSSRPTRLPSILSSPSPPSSARQGQGTSSLCHLSPRLSGHSLSPCAPALAQTYSRPLISQGGTLPSGILHSRLHSASTVTPLPARPGAVMVPALASAWTLTLLLLFTLSALLNPVVPLTSLQ